MRLQRVAEFFLYLNTSATPQRLQCTVQYSTVQGATGLLAINKREREVPLYDRFRSVCKICAWPGTNCKNYCYNNFFESSQPFIRSRLIKFIMYRSVPTDRQIDIIIIINCLKFQFIFYYILL